MSIPIWYLKEENPGTFFGTKKRKILILKAEPENANAEVVLMMSSGLEIYSVETGGTKITDREWNISNIPDKFYIQGTTASAAMMDKECKLEWKNVADISDTAKVTVVTGDMNPGTLFTAVTNHETDVAYVHWNIDNDDNSATVSGEPAKHPGGDYKQNSVTGEDNLKSLSLSFTPDLDVGTVKLTVGASAKLWKSATKGPTEFDLSNLVLTSGTKSWNLANATEKADFNAVKSSLFVEGINGGGPEDFKWEYEPPVGSEFELDKVKYKFIAANCGRQPQIAQVYSNPTVSPNPISEKEYVMHFFPSLVGCEWSILGPTDPRYNCIAYSVGLTDRWIVKFGPETFDKNKPNLGGKQAIDVSYGNGNGVLEDTEIHEFFKQEGNVEPIATNESDAKIIYYDGFHAAKRRNCTCGEPKWHMFESKCGEAWILEHQADQIGGNYGNPHFYYK